MEDGPTGYGVIGGTGMRDAFPTASSYEGGADGGGGAEGANTTFFSIAPETTRRIIFVK